MASKPLRKTGRFVSAEALTALQMSVESGHNVANGQLRRLAAHLGVKLEPGDVAVDEAGEILSESETVH
jgi:hypothetical protein